MHVHAANQHPAHHACQILAQHIIAVLVSVVLFLPVRKRMTRGGNRGQPVFGRMFGNAGAQAFQIIAGLTNCLANLGADFDLALQEFGTDLTLEFSHAIVHHRLRRLRQSKRFKINQQVFFFNANGEGGVCSGHDLSSLLVISAGKPG